MARGGLPSLVPPGHSCWRLYTPGCSRLLPGLDLEGIFHLAPCLDGMGFTGAWVEKCKYGCLSLPVVTVSCGANKSPFMAGVPWASSPRAGSFGVLQLF